MSVYSRRTIENLHQELTSFRTEEGYITFYTEADYAANLLRSNMTPIGTYLFSNGLSLQESVEELPAYQGFGSKYKNLVKAGCVGCNLQIQALYTQEASASWCDPGHPELIAYIDYIDDTLPSGKKSGDILNSQLELSQTLVVRHLRCVSRNLVSSENSITQYSLTFNGGWATRLAANAMDL